MDECQQTSKLDQELFDAMAEFIGQMLARGERMAERTGLPVFCVKALHWLDPSIAMKELGRRMRCDPSFVTAIADTLEQRGLARREPSTTDRRIKNLVLTSVGQELKRRIEGEFVAEMPWCRVFDEAERQTFLALIRKLVDAGRATPAGQAGAERPTATGQAGPERLTAAPQDEPARAEEVSDALSTASRGPS